MKFDRFTLSISFSVAVWRRAQACGLECRSSKACATIWHWIAVRERRGGGSSEAVKGCVRFRSRFQQRFIHQILFDWNLANAMKSEKPRNRKRKSHTEATRCIARVTSARASRKAPARALSNSIYAFSYFPFCFASCSLSSINSLTPC